MEKTCNDCGWFVAETNKIGDYQHSEAVKRQEGFCLMKDLFTSVSPDYEACKCYQDGTEKREKKYLINSIKKYKKVIK